VFELRLPRTLTAFAAGGVLALAGVLMQVLLRNPLADPFIMGVSGGAAVAALSAMLLGNERAAHRRQRYAWEPLERRCWFSLWRAAKAAGP
jgi:ABC-type Fe3+-siderophore transport system permease subunit